MLTATTQTPDTLSEEALATIREFMAALGMAVRTHGLYPPGHSALVSATERVWATFQQVSRHTDVLTFTVSEDGFHVDRQVVLRSAGGTSCPAGKLRREGVQQVRVQSTAPLEELTAFAGILAREFAPDESEDDLVTLLWEADFQSITYDLVDAPTPYQDGTEREPGGGIPGAMAGGASVVPAEEQPEVSLVDVSGADAIKERLSSMYATSDSGALQSIDWGAETSPHGEFARILRRVLADADDQEVLAAAASQGIDLVFLLTREGKVEQASQTLADLDAAYERAEPDGREGVMKALARLATPDFIACVKAAVLAKSKPEPAALGELFIRLPDGFVGLFAPEALRLSAVYPFLDIYRAAAPRHLPAVYKLLSGGDRDLVLFALSVIEGAADAGVLHHLDPAIRSEHSEVRLRTLTLVRRYANEPRALELLIPLLRDSSADIREQAVGDLALTRSPRALAAIWSCVNDDDFLNYPRAEKEGTLLNLAANAANESIPILRDLLERRKLLGGAKQREAQEVAILALGRVGTERSDEVLRYYAAKGPRWMRDVCAEALSRRREVAAR